MPIHRLVYSSANAVSLADQSLLAHLREILSVSQKNNQRDGLTGYLLFEPKWFLQILEGDQPIVKATYDRIARDKRHTSVTLMEARSVALRSFSGWSMGGCLRTPEVEGIYLRHGISGVLKPSTLKGPQVIALALDLQAHEAARRQRQSGATAA